MSNRNNKRPLPVVAEPMGEAPELSDREREVVLSAVVNYKQAEQNARQAAEAVDAALKALPGVCRTILMLKGVNPDAWAIRVDEHGTDAIIVPVT